MYILALIKEILSIKRTVIITYIFNTIILLLFFNLQLNVNEILNPLLMSSFILVIYLLIELIKYKNFKTNIHDAKSSPDYINTSFDIDAQIIFDSIKEVHEKYIKTLFSQTNTFNQRNYLFSQWIHNMKTSITIINLASEKILSTDTTTVLLNDIQEETNKLKYNIEQALNILRLNNFSKDYIPQKTNLLEIVNKAVNSKKKDFIYNKIFPKVNIDKSLEIFTDVKWFKYIIEQIISNSIKYSPKNAFVYITANIENNKTTLIIKDIGIGIPIEDISRVFDPFFTGSNGRLNNNSSGIGLYMVKQICTELNHFINIKSSKEEGTTVSISNFALDLNSA